jgi:hypothetical protein
MPLRSGGRKQAPGDFSGDLRHLPGFFIVLLNKEINVA